MKKQVLKNLKRQKKVIEKIGKGKIPRNLKTDYEILDEKIEHLEKNIGKGAGR